MSEAIQVTLRPVVSEAFRWDGSVTGAQAIAIWLAEKDGRDAWEEVSFHSEIRAGATLRLREAGETGGGRTADPGDWIVRHLGMTLISDQESFDYYFQAASLLQIKESR